MDARGRFENKIKKSRDGCWTWLAGKTTNGYGLFWTGNRTMNAHRWIYEQERGPVPMGMQLGHLCRNRICVNPVHLELVTPRENISRSPTHNINKTHCPQGHEYDEKNTLMSRGRRTCRECNRVKSLARYHAGKKRRSTI